MNYAYEGEESLLDPPARPAPDSATWGLLLARVEEADRREVAQASAESGRPVLLALTTLPGRGLVAVVGRRSRSQPSSETLTFDFRSGGQILCRVSSSVVQWEQVGDDTAVEGQSSRYLQWLTRHGLQKDIFQGLADLDVESCPTEELQGSEVLLEGADELADRVGI